MTPARLSWLAFAWLWLALSTGWIKLPLPYPAVGRFAEPVPPHIYPWRPASLRSGPFAIRHRLNATRLFEGQVAGSESVTVAPDGSFIMLDKYGAVRTAQQQQAPQQPELVLQPQPLAHLGPGRPLGAAFDAAGNLLVCDAFKGLIMLPAQQQQPGGNQTQPRRSSIVLLSNRVSPSSPLQPGSAITYANDLDIGPDGTVYFTDSVDISPHRNAQHVNTVSHIVSVRGQRGYYDTVKAWALGMLQGLPRGRLLAYYPANRTTHVIADGLYYPNGVALARDGSWLALAETDRLRVLRVFLPPHARAGQREVLIDRLPGTPDGVARASGPAPGFWVSLVSNVPAFTKWFGSPLVRGLLGRLPENWRPQVPTWGAVLKVSESGALLQWLVDEAGASASKVASAHEADGRLYLGNLSGDYVAFVRLDELPPDAAEDGAGGVGGAGGHAAAGSEQAQQQQQQEEEEQRPAQQAQQQKQQQEEQHQAQQRQEL